MEKARILIVDDEEDLREILCYQLDVLGAELETAENGRLALEAAKSKWFDAILSDISMPEMTGLEFLAELRALGHDTPFVILTGFGDKAKAVEALRLGAFDFLEKPWDPETVRRTMRGAVEVGTKLRDIEAELDQIMSGFQNVPAEQIEQLRKVQRSLIVMRLHRNLIRKNS